MAEFEDSDKTEEWISQIMPLAESGNADAQIQVGWAFYRGTFGQKDPKAAEVWFRRAAESGAGERAYFELVKMLRIEMSDRIRSVYEERKWSLGAIHSMYADYLAKVGPETPELKRVLEIGASNGSLVAKLHLHIVTHKGLQRILGLPTELRLVAQLFIVKYKDDDDPQGYM